MTGDRRAWLVIAPLMSLLVHACGREIRDLRPAPRFAATRSGARYAHVAGPGGAIAESTRRAERVPNTFALYRENAYAIAEGKRLFYAYNCSGCHANGGGGMGPPLMDARRCLTCQRAEDIFSTIVDGRRNGMPAFGGRIPEYQVWQITAYVRSLSGLARMNAAPGRSDHMNVRPAENSMRRPRDVVAPP